MGNYIIFARFENPRRGSQARNLTTNIPKILDLKSSSAQIFSKNRRWVPLRHGLDISNFTRFWGLTLLSILDGYELTRV